MKKVTLLSAAFVAFIMSLAIAQEDTTRNLTLKPGNDSVAHQQYRSENFVAVSPDQLPESVKKTLASKEYQGWEKSPIYHDKTTGLYILEKKDGITTKVYRFDKNGKPASGTIPPREKRKP
jgi:hypothetical protein